MKQVHDEILDASQDRHERRLAAIANRRAEGAITFEREDGLEGAVSYLEKFVASYRDETFWETYEVDTFMLDVLYALGVSVRGEAGEWANGAERFLKDLQEWIGVRLITGITRDLSPYPEGDVAEKLRADIAVKQPGMRIIGIRYGSAIDLDRENPDHAFLPARELGGWVAIVHKDGEK